MKKKYYFAIVFILIGLSMGFMAMMGLEKVGFNNRGMPISILLGTCAAFILIGLSFIIIGKR